jgi:hypothetical protein
MLVGGGHVMRKTLGILTTIGLVAGILALGPGGAVLGKQAVAKAVLYDPLDYQPVSSFVGFQMRYGRNEYSGGLNCTSPDPYVGRGSFRLAFDLRDGAGLTKVTVWYGDLNPDKALLFEVWDRGGGYEPEIGGGIPGMRAESLTGIPDPEEPPQYLELVPTSPVIVDNAQHRYSLSAIFEQCDDLVNDVDAWLALGEVRVDYTIP